MTDSALTSPGQNEGAEASEEERARASRLLRAAAHDLRGPVANVRAYAAFLKDPKMDLAPKAQRALEVILRNADRALWLMREYFDSEQAARGCLELPTEPLEVRKVAEAAVKAHAALLAERKVAVELADGDAAVLAERMALDHMLTTVLEHAIARTTEGGTVLVRIATVENQAVLSVIDRGPPIPAAEHKELFDRDAWLRKHPKLGIGFRLSLAATEARLMGGTLEVQSAEGQTTFLLRLPSAAA